MNVIRYTLWPSLTDIDHPTTVEETWDALVRRFSTHTPLPSKEASSGFGPYVTHAPASPCVKHKSGPIRTGPHRCNACVSEVTLLVCDADQARSMDEVLACDARLADAGLARHWYSSFSFHPATRPAFRLILPLERPVAAAHWKDFRAEFLARYGIPADPKSSSSVSHYYHAPSRRPDWSEPVVLTGGGNPVPVPAQSAPTSRRLMPEPRAVDLGEYEPPEEPTEPVNVVPLLEELRARLSRMKRNPAQEYKARLLERCLAGEELETHGARNEATLILTGVVAYAIPDQPLSVYRHILAPSVEAMIAAGSTLTWDEVERMLLTAMRARWEADARQRALLENLRRRVAALPVVHT